MTTAVANVRTVPARRPAQAARQRLLEQHTELRRLLAMGVVQALGIVDQRGAAPAVLRSLVHRIEQLFTEHAAEEEAQMLPVFERDVPWDPCRAERLRAEHAQQRADLRALVAWPESGSELELAARFDLLARDLLRDIAREERDFLRAADRFQWPG
jgi:hypothetical protein